MKKLMRSLLEMSVLSYQLLLKEIENGLGSFLNQRKSKSFDEDYEECKEK